MLPILAGLSVGRILAESEFFLGWMQGQLDCHEKSLLSSFLSQFTVTIFSILESKHPRDREQKGESCYQTKEHP